MLPSSVQKSLLCHICGEVFTGVFFRLLIIFKTLFALQNVAHEEVFIFVLKKYTAYAFLKPYSKVD